MSSISKKLKGILELKTNEKCPLCDTVLTGSNKEEAVAHLTSEQKTLQEMLDKGIATLNKNAEAYNSVNTVIKQADLEINKLKNQQTELKLSIKESEGLLKRIQEKRVIADKNQKDIETKEKEFLKFQSIIDLFTPLKDVFGKNGIPVYIIDKVLPEVELIANDILEKLTNGKFSVVINTQKESGNKISETFEIKILNQGKPRGYKLYSGGQRFVIDLALRMALSVILARRKNFTIETLIIDEGFSALDLRNRQLVIFAINELYKKFNLKKLILMTHCEEISENIERIIKVEMTNGESSVE
jgi:exonuclease SbcC